MEKLKKCPFCGGKAELSVKHGFKGEVIAAFVYCTKMRNEHTKLCFTIYGDRIMEQGKE